MNLSYMKWTRMREMSQKIIVRETSEICERGNWKINDWQLATEEEAYETKYDSLSFEEDLELGKAWLR